MAKKFLTSLGLISLASDPTSGTEGELYYNNVSDGVRLYKNGAWTDLISTGNLPSGGTTGEILAKSSNTDYAVEWIENYADYTEVVKLRVKNDGTRALYKGQPVYVTGADGTNVLVGRSSNITEGSSSKTIGILAQNLATNGQGFVIKEGKLGTLDTSAAGAVGDPVWLGVDGALIYGLANKPYAPAHLVYLGVVTKKNGSTGEIFVQVQNGFEIRELHDVGIGYSASIQNNEILAYNSASSVWINQTPSESGIVITDDLLDYLTEISASSTYLTKVDASTTYLTQIDADASFQPLDTVLSNISDLELSSGFLVSNGIDDWYIDENEYLTTANASSTYLSQEDAAVIYLAQSTAASAYQPIGEYLIGEDLNAYLTESSASATYQPVGDYLIPADLYGYLTESSASTTYQPLDEDLTQISLLNSSTATAGLLATNGSGYWTIDTTAYLTTESDPVFTASDAYGIDSTDISNWNEAHGWGDHSGAGYALNSHNHTLDSLSNVDINSLADGDSIVWNSASSAWINQVISGGSGATTTVSETAPSTPSTGDSWYKQSTGSFFIYDGSYWVEVTSVITMSDEEAQDKIAPLFDHSNHENITSSYDDINNEIILSVSSSPTFTGKVEINDFIKFVPTDTKPTWSEGNLYYDSEEKTLILQGAGSTFEQTFGQREWVRCRNTSGSTIYKGQPVYVTGVHIPGDPTHGHHPTIALADASDVVKKEVIGIAGENINDGSHGYIVVRGYIEGFDTSSLTSGSRAHLGFEYPGQITVNAPEYPNYPMDLGICLTSASVNGTFYVNIFDHSFERVRVQYGAYIDGDLTVDGNITLNGEGSQISVTSLSLQDNWLYVGAGDSIATNSASVSGLDDMLFKGHYEGGSNVIFYVKIDGTSNPNTFAWSYDNFATTEASGISITGNLQSLEDGISVQFEATTGHTLNDKWTGPVVVENLDFGFIGNYVDSGTYTHSGIFRDATDNTFKIFQSYNPEITGNINVGDASFAFGKLKVSSLDVTDTSTTKSNLGIGNVENTALSTWAGSSNITTLGTITSGTWSGTQIGTSKGGTGLTSIGTANQILRVNSGATALEWATLDALPSQSGNNGKYLTTNGSAASWGTLDLSLYLTLSSASTTYLTQSSASTTYATKASPILTTPNIGAATGTSLTTTGNVVSHIDILTPTFTTNAYTLIAGDDGDLLMLNNSSSSGSLYVPTDASANFTIGTQITMVQSGTGQITVLATTPGTTTVNSTPGSKLRAQWSSATLVKTAANTWILMGDLSV
jgi:hypothetical protein